MMKDKVVLVTGASVGIGRAAAIALGSQSARVVVNYVQAEDSARETVEAVIAAGGQARGK